MRGEQTFLAHGPQASDDEPPGLCDDGSEDLDGEGEGEDDDENAYGGGGVWRFFVREATLGKKGPSTFERGRSRAQKR